MAGPFYSFTSILLFILSKSGREQIPAVSAPDDFRNKEHRNEKRTASVTKRKGKIKVDPLWMNESGGWGNKIIETRTIEQKYLRPKIDIGGRQRPLRGNISFACA
jgi:hypothetical protein